MGMARRASPTPEPFLEPDDIRALSELPACDRLWVGGRRRMPHDDDQTDAVFWIDVEANEVRAFDMVARGRQHEALLRLLVSAMAAPEEGLAPARPTAVASDDPRLTAYLAPLDIDVRNAPRSLVDQMFDAMVDLLGDEEGPRVTYLARPGVTRKSVKAFYEAAARIFRSAPWQHISEHDLARIDGLGPQPLFVLIDGSDGNEPAIAFLEHESDARAMLDTSTDDADALPPHLVLSYEARGVDDLLDEAREHGFSLAAGDAVPVLLRSSDDAELLASETDLVLATRALEALAAIDEQAARARSVDTRVGGLRIVWPCLPPAKEGRKR